MADPADAFKAQLNAFREKEIATQAVGFQRRITFAGLRKIVNRWAVDSGDSRGGVQVSIGAPSFSDASMGTSAAAVIAAGKTVIDEMHPYDNAFVGTNRPEAPVLEFGLYPNPPKHGSRIRSRDLPSRGRGRITKALAASGIRYIVKSAGGYSLQAPQGMVRITAQELDGYSEG